MIDHVGFPVADFPRAKAFYERALAPLGYVLVMEVQQAANDASAAGFGAGGKPDFWIGGEGKLDRPLHIAIAAKDRATVDAFYHARSPQVQRTTARQACVRATTPIITAPSCAIPTATTSRRCATRAHESERRENGFQIMRKQNGY